MGHLYIFHLISLRDIFSINGPTLILKIIGQCDVKHDVTVNTITSVLKVSTYIITKYHSFFCWTRCDNVCPDLHNCRYFICVMNILIENSLSSFQHYIVYMCSKKSQTQRQETDLKSQKNMVAKDLWMIKIGQMTCHLIKVKRCHDLCAIDYIFCNKKMTYVIECLLNCLSFILSFSFQNLKFL